MPKPTRQPNKIHPQILGALIATKPVSTKFKEIDPEDPKKVVTRKVTRTGLRYPLAQNVQEANIDIAAKRWIK